MGRQNCSCMKLWISVANGPKFAKVQGLFELAEGYKELLLSSEEPIPFKTLKDVIWPRNFMSSNRKKNDFLPYDFLCMLLYYFFERGEAVKRWRNEKWLQKISYYCYTAHSENGPIDGTWSTYLLDVLFACSTAVTHVKMTAKT